MDGDLNKMHQMIKAIFFDIDGTLVSFRTHEISARSLRTLARLQEKGVRLFIASGRHFLTMDNLGNFPFDGYICMNGAVIYSGGKVIFRRPVGCEDAEKVAEIAENHHIPCAVFFENTVGMNFLDVKSRDVLKMVRMPLPPIISFREPFGQPVYQYTIFADGEQERNYLRPALKGSALSRWHPGFLDINPENMSKAVAIERVISGLGIRREEVMAFGDGGNDVEMLDYAGIGVAMGNASPDVQSHADYVTDTVDDEGVTKAVAHFGL